MKKSIKLGVFRIWLCRPGSLQCIASDQGNQCRNKKICIKHPEKRRPIDASFFTTNRDEILNDPEIDVVVELIDEVDAAFEIVSSALKKRKAVVSANKKMIAENFAELAAISSRNTIPLFCMKPPAVPAFR